MFIRTLRRIRNALKFDHPFLKHPVKTTCERTESDLAVFSLPVWSWRFTLTFLPVWFIRRCRELISAAPRYFRDRKLIQPLYTVWVNNKVARSIVILYRGGSALKIGFYDRVFSWRAYNLKADFHRLRKTLLLPIL